MKGEAAGSPQSPPPAAASCLFCRIVAGSIPARKVEIPEPGLDRDLLAFEDVNPQAPHHVLVIPREHIGSLNDLTPRHAELMGKILLAARAIARGRGFAQNGYRVVVNTNAAAGQTVFHIHLHLLGGRHLAWPPG